MLRALFPVEGKALQKVFRADPEYLRQSEERGEGVRPSGLELLVVADGEPVLDDVFLDHALFAPEEAVPCAQLAEGFSVRLFHVFQR